MDLDVIKRDGKKVLLSFSCGKDSLTSWVFLREAGFEVTPFYMQLIPGLGFIERSLTYYENFFDTHIYRVLHPNLWASIDLFEGQPPEREQGIRFLRLPIFDYRDIEAGVKRTAGLSSSTWTAVGMRYADSPMQLEKWKSAGIH